MEEFEQAVPMDAPQPSAAPQGAAPMEQGFEGGMSEQSSTIRANVVEAINQLPQEAKDFVEAFMTQEQVVFLRLLFGDDVADALGQFVNPNVALLPLPREDVNAVLQQLNQGQEQAPQGALTPQQQPQQAATLPPTGQAPMM